MQDGQQLSKQYKEKLSNFSTWSEKDHSEDWLLYPENIGKTLCLDETALSDGELYTVLTNAEKRCKKGSIVAIVKGTKSKEVLKILAKIPLSKRNTVKEIGVDMAKNMEKIAKQSFPNATIVTDRFHIAKLVNEAVQHVRIKHRWEAIEEENKAVKRSKSEEQKYSPKQYSNGDTKKQLLARSRYVLFKTPEKWTISQRTRAEILFSEYTDIKEAYYLSLGLRQIYEQTNSRQTAINKLSSWHKKVEATNLSSMIKTSESIKVNSENMLNYFNNRTTNALAETFNSILKSFRRSFRGVRDISFFLYRVTLIYA